MSSEAPQRPDPQPQQPSSSTTTLGDTLWQVHLSRQQKAAARGAADDYDHEAGVGHLHPQGGVSVGDELWQVHCQRARGRLDEEEEDEEQAGKRRNQEQAPNEACQNDQLRQDHSPAQPRCHGGWCLELSWYYYLPPSNAPKTDIHTCTHTQTRNIARARER